jgi:hypothetical protein
MSRPAPPFTESPEIKYRRTFVSKKISAALIRFEPIETESGRKPTAEFTQPPQKFLGRRSPLYLKHTSSGDMNLYIVPFFQPERLDDGLGQTDGEAVSPFGDVHDVHSNIR